MLLKRLLLLVNTVVSHSKEPRISNMIKFITFDFSYHVMFFFKLRTNSKKMFNRGGAVSARINYVQMRRKKLDLATAIVIGDVGSGQDDKTR